MFRTFIQILALGLTAGSSFFLIRSVITMSAKDIAELAATKYGFSYQIADNLTQQRSDTIVGFTLLLMSLFVALVNFLWPMRIDDFGIDYRGVVTGIMVSIGMFVAGSKVSDYWHRSSYKQVADILKERSEAAKRPLKEKDYETFGKLSAPPPRYFYCKGR